MTFVPKEVREKTVEVIVNIMYIAYSLRIANSPQPARPILGVKRY
jgi:hypothetical protein